MTLTQRTLFLEIEKWGFCFNMSGESILTCQMINLDFTVYWWIFIILKTL
jgi:hypothetical protein